MDQPVPGYNYSDIFYRFAPDSTLQEFLSARGRGLGGFYSRYFRMDRLVYTLREVLKEDGMITDEEPGMIVCNDELKAVLGPSALHTKQLGTYCIPHVVLLPLADQVRLRQKYRGVAQHLAEDAGEEAMEILDHVYLLPTQRFYVRPDLRKLFNDVIPSQRDKKTLTFAEVLYLFRLYCMNKDIVDARNSHVAILRGDPIADLLKRDVVHQDQVCYLLAPFVACVNLWDEEDDGSNDPLDPWKNADEMDGPCF
jgi:hypothetical protein